MVPTHQITTYRLTPKGAPHADRIKRHLNARQLLNVWECTHTERVEQLAEQGFIIIIQ